MKQHKLLGENTSFLFLNTGLLNKYIERANAGRVIFDHKHKGTD